MQPTKDPAFKHYFYLLKNITCVKSFNMCSVPSLTSSGTCMPHITSDVDALSISYYALALSESSMADLAYCHLMSAAREAWYT